jgi:hypothetical protein
MRSNATSGRITPRSQPRRCDRHSSTPRAPCKRGTPRLARPCTQRHPQTRGHPTRPHPARNHLPRRMAPRTLLRTARRGIPAHHATHTRHRLCHRPCPLPHPGTTVGMCGCCTPLTRKAVLAGPLPRPGMPKWHCRRPRLSLILRVGALPAGTVTRRRLSVQIAGGVADLGDGLAEVVGDWAD